MHTYSIHVNDRSNSALLRLKMTDELLISKFPTTLRFLLSRCIPIIQQSIWNLKHLNERNKTRRDQITQDRNQYSPKKVKRIEIMRKLLAVCSKMNEWKSLSHSPTHLHSSTIHKQNKSKSYYTSACDGKNNQLPEIQGEEEEHAVIWHFIF